MFDEVIKVVKELTMHIARLTAAVTEQSRLTNESIEVMRQFIAKNKG